MASTSNVCFRSSEELCEFLTTLESASEDSDEDELYGDDSASNSDNFGSESVQIDPVPALAQKWNDGKFVATVHNFDNSNAGITTHNLTANSSILDYFMLFVSSEIVQNIANETNRFFVYSRNKEPPTHASRLNKWKDTCVNELYLFFALTMLMVRTKKLSIQEYWTTDPLFECPQFRNLMSRDRYLLLLRLLHFCDNEQQPEGDRLYKLKIIVDDLRTKFRDTFRPFQNLCIDESMVLFKGRLLFKQFIPSKRTRFGIKLFLICDCETGYILDFIVYTGKDTHIIADREFGISGAVVQTLMGNYLNKGHTLWVDNWYSSPRLFQFLHTQNTNACGTVRKNRKEMPQFTRKLKKGEVEAKHSDSMTALRWLDRREVCLLSTLHSDEMQPTGKRDKDGNPINKPKCVIEYNQNMGAVDRTDMLISSIECLRKSMKWYKKLFFHFLDMSLLNAHTLYKVNTGKNTSLAEFQAQLVREMVQKYHIPSGKKGRPSGAVCDNPLRLTEKHFLTLVPPTPKKKTATRVCIVCSKTTTGKKVRKESRYMCSKCDVGLCVVPCFEKYHSLLNY